MPAFFQLYRANWSEFLGDRRAIFLTVAFPIILILLFGVLFGSPERQAANIGLFVPQPDDRLAKELAKAFEDLPKADDKNHALSALKFRRGALEELKADVRRGVLDAVITIPPDAEGRAGREEKVQLVLTADVSRQTLVPFLQGLINGVLHEFDARISGREPILSLRTDSIQGRELRAIDYLLPGILALSMLQIGLFATPQGLIAMRVSGVLKRLGATPLRRSTLLSAYISMRLTIAIAQTALIMVVGRWVFGVAMLGSWPVFGGLVLLGTLTFIALGFFTAAIAKSEESGTAIANFLNLPMILLGGIFFTLDNLPQVLTWIVSALPLPYLADAFRQVMVDAPPVHDLQTSVLVLSGWTLVSAALAVRFFQWEPK